MFRKVLGVFLVAGLAIVLVLISDPTPARADERNPNPGIIPAHAEPHGKSYGEWAAAWWQWALSIPAERNPLLDPNGQFCGEGQSGPVWFYAGTFGSNAERWCTVPAGKTIFMPVYNWIFGAAVFDCEPTVPGVPCDVPTLRAKAAAAVNAAEIVTVSIDGELIEDVFAYRQVCPEPFEITLPEGAVFGLPAGTFFPHVTDGFWLMLTPLPLGEHTLRAYVYAPTLELEFEIITHLTVE
ncbi:MAG: hypothetical protein AB1716_12590 [Planctomycetota bacterium]